MEKITSYLLGEFMLPWSHVESVTYGLFCNIPRTLHRLHSCRELIAKFMENIIHNIVDGELSGFRSLPDQVLDHRYAHHTEANESYPVNFLCH